MADNCSSGLGAISRATTPEHEFTFEEDIWNFKKVLITYAQNGKIVITKDKDDLELDPNTPNVGIIRLSEEETNLFDPNAYVDIEVRVYWGESVPPPAKFKMPVTDVINDEILKTGDF